VQYIAYTAVQVMTDLRCNYVKTVQYVAYTAWCQVYEYLSTWNDDLAARNLEAACSRNPKY